MSYFSDLKQLITDGIEGKNKGHSLGMPRLEKYVSLRKKLYFMIMGSTGSGKSSLLYDSFILNPLEILESQRREKKTEKKLKYVLLLMERSKAYIHAKWLIRRIFLDKGVLIPMNQLLSWYGDKLSDRALAYIDEYEDYFDFLEDRIEIYEGGRSPKDVYRIGKEIAEKYGEDTEINSYKKQYISKEENLEIVFCVDHLGLIKTGKDYPSKKQAIDATVEFLQYFRDHFGWTIIAVNQLNRDLSNPIYTKMDSFEPHIDNAKETGNTTEAADIVLSLFDPLRFKTNDPLYGDVSCFKSPETGHKYFRNIKVLKNSYGIDDASVGTVFMGETGVFKELPKSNYIKENWKTSDYEAIFNNSYFLQ